MRIIAGEFRGRRLLDPLDRATRPITDRVKQSIFDVLGARVEGAYVFDVFAGTGSFGLESLSRGATGCAFFERHRPAVERLRRNIETLAVGPACRVATGDVFRLGEADVAALPRPGLIFFDPPYPFLRERPDELLGLLMRFSGHVADGGLIVFRHDEGDAFDVGLPVLDERVWGSMRVRFLGRPVGA